MNILSNIAQRLGRIATFAELEGTPVEVSARVLDLSDLAVIDIARDLASMANDVARLQALIAAVAARRSARTTGHTGLAATQGHSSPAALIQAITGGTKGDATRQIRVGTALLDETARPSAIVDTPELRNASQWHMGLRRAVLDRRITTVQHDVIRRGLGDPPDDSDDACDVWATAADQLVREAPTLTWEDLGTRARALRDALDVRGAEERHARRYASRSFRMWKDDHGQFHARIAFDDEMGLWMRAIRDAALRPRRGGPRFLTDEERALAARLVDDPRTNEQLHYDLMMSLVTSGALADAKDVFGARQPGVRVIMVAPEPGALADGHRDAFNRLLVVGNAEDGGEPLAGSVIDRTICTNGTRSVTVDSRGNPLDVGHEHRLFTTRQRIALAARDGGCMWPSCSLPASYCEAHHIDHVADGGRTDIDRGILLCRHHHLLLHNRGWKVRRAGAAAFILHPPPDIDEPPTNLTSRAPWKWAWDPPTPPRRPEWRSA